LSELLPAGTVSTGTRVTNFRRDFAPDIPSGHAKSGQQLQVG